MLNSKPAELQASFRAIQSSLIVPSLIVPVLAWSWLAQSAQSE
ncbi:hypothetical protein AB6D20_027410 (plasmid) [Vibrio splendidus]